MGTRAERCDDVGKLVSHQVAADHLMVEMPLLEDLMVEEMPERAMADVVQQARDAECLLHQRG